MSTTIEVNYHPPYFEEKEIAILIDEFSSIGSMRVREIAKELGGDDANLWIAIKWFGISVASGVIQHLTAKLYEKIANAVGNYRRKCEEQSIAYNEAVNLVISYDDLDININLPAETTIDFLPQIMRDITAELERETLRTKPIAQIFLPYFFDELEQLWRQSFDWSKVEFESRFWGIQSERYSYRSEIINDIYDSKEHRFIHAPYESIFENVL